MPVCLARLVNAPLRRVNLAKNGIVVSSFVSLLQGRENGTFSFLQLTLAHQRLNLDCNDGGPSDFCSRDPVRIGNGPPFRTPLRLWLRKQHGLICFESLLSRRPSRCR